MINSFRNLIAFTEYGDRPLLVVYDLEARKKLKLLRCAEFRSHDVVSLAFSHDSKYILVQGGHPDYQLVYFFWEKGKVITSITRVVSQSSGGAVGSVSFHPKVRHYKQGLQTIGKQFTLFVVMKRKFTIKFFLSLLDCQSSSFILLSPISSMECVTIKADHLP